MSVTILCPNGRRQAVKVSPNTTIAEVLESVCQKQNYDPNSYDLFRDNKPLDVSLTIRFANIPNNGQIELKAVPPKTEQKVTLAVDLSADVVERKIGQFDPNNTLWDIIQVLFAGSPALNLNQDMEFCIIYMRKEICGETQLKAMNLKSLGLIRGKAALKLIIRPINANRQQAYVESLNLKKPSDTTPVIKNRQTIDRVIDKHAEKDDKSLKKVEDMDEDWTAPQPQPQPLTTPEHNSTPSTSSAQHPNEPTIEDENTKLASNADVVQQMEVESEESEDEGEEVVNFLDANESQVMFKMSDLPKVTRIDYPDEFYETTKDDLQRVLCDLRKQQVGTSEAPLETQQMKEMREKQNKTTNYQKKHKVSRYKSTVIRVCFPSDQLVIQAVFQPTATVEEVMRVVRPFVTVQDFYLYTVPPKCVLKADSTLIEEELVPAAVVHFGLKSSSSAQNVIKDEFRPKLTSYRSAAKIAANARKEVIKRANESNEVAVTAANSQSVANPASQESSSQMGQQPKIPRWFKKNNK